MDTPRRETCAPSFDELEHPTSDDGKKKARNHRHHAVVLKRESRSDLYLFPKTIEECVSRGHVVRFVSAIVDRLDLPELEERLKGGGAGAYNPRTLLKIWVYGWIRKIYTSRPLAAALTRDTEFIWIASGLTPSFMTLANFRRSLNTDIKSVFRNVVKFGVKAGLIDGSELYVDHTKVAANANRHRIVWRKSQQRYLDRVNADLDRVLALVDQLNAEEECSYASAEKREAAVAALTREQLDELIDRVTQAVKADQMSREEAKEKKDLLRRGKDCLEKKARYEKTLQTLGKRNSMTKSDKDASAMRMKDHVTVRGAYNVGVACQNGFVVGYDVSCEAGDGGRFQPTVADAEAATGRKPDRVCADAGYGNEENYRYMEKRKIGSFVKYPGWNDDRRGKKRPYGMESFSYDEEQDRYICPQGYPLPFRRLSRRRTKTGFPETRRIYTGEWETCASCPVREACTRSANRPRSLTVGRTLQRLRTNALQNLSTQTGVRMRKRRGPENETVFGIWKWAWKFDRFHMRGTPGVTVESGLYFTAYNIRRMYQAFVRYAEEGTPPPLLLSGAGG